MIKLIRHQNTRYFINPEWSYTIAIQSTSDKELFLKRVIAKMIE